MGIEVDCDGKKMESVFYHLEAGDTFGQLSFEKEVQTRHAAAWCTKKSYFLVISRDHFKKFKEGIAYRISSSKIMFFKSVPVLKDLSSTKLKHIET